MCMVWVQLRRVLSPLDKMAAILAAASHDADHPGVNQGFLTATDNPLCQLYHVSADNTMSFACETVLNERQV